MSLYPYQFPEDLTGQLPRNKVTNEERSFANNAERIFIPSGGPFFTDSLRIKDKRTGAPLEPITQYKCLHLHTEGTLDSGQQVCCIILISDTSVADVVYSYQAIGGKYGEVMTTIKDIIADVDWTQITRISWGENIYGKPEVYPAAAHRHPGTQFGDWKRFHVALNNIYHAILNKEHAAWRSVYDFIDRKIEVAMKGLSLDGSQYYTKTEIDNKFEALTKSINDKFDKLAPQSPADMIANDPRNQIKLLGDKLFFTSYVVTNAVFTDYTITLNDVINPTLIRVNSASAVRVTVPKLDSQIPVGTFVHVRRVNGRVIIVPATGVTITPADSLDLRRAGITSTLVCVGINQWELISELV